MVEWDEQRGGYICSEKAGPTFGEFIPHEPTLMEQDWMWGDVYRCPTCGTVIEVGPES